LHLSDTEQRRLTITQLYRPAVEAGNNGCGHPGAPGQHGQRGNSEQEEEKVKKSAAVTAAALIILTTGAGVPGFAQTVDGTIDDDEYRNTMTAGENFFLSWELQDEILFLAFSAPTTGWVALGISPVQAMDQADMIMGAVDQNGTVRVADEFSTGRFGPHAPDVELGGTSDLLSYAGSETAGVTTIEVSRRADTGDEYDKPVSGGEVVIWAHGTSDDFSSPHQARGTFTLASATEDLAGAGGLPTARVVGFGEALQVHLWLMLASGLAMSAGLLFPRYLKQKKWWMKAHRMLGIAGPVLGGLGLAAAVYMVEVRGGGHLSAVHGWFGLVAAAGFFATPPLCRRFFRIRREKKKAARASHRWTGRAALVIMLAAIVLGLFRAGWL
jgi:hypothetical protein